MSGMPTAEPPSDEVSSSANSALRRLQPMRWFRRGIDALPNPHPILVMSLEDLVKAPPPRVASPDAPGIARPAGWQFIVPRRGEPTAIEVDRSLDVRIEEGPRVASALEVYRAGPPWEETAEDSSVSFLLRIPEMALAAVWFRALNRPREAVVPLFPSPGQFEPQRVYEAEDFFLRAADTAHLRLMRAAEQRDEEMGG
jgi:hypothetical protein